MKNFALIKNEVVENVIVADDDFADSIKAEWDSIVEVGTSAGNPRIGDRYTGGKFFSRENDSEMEVSTDERPEA